MGVVRVSEKSDFATTGDDVDDRHTSYHVLGGLEIPVHRWVGVGFQAGYRWVPDALTSDLAETFDETTLNNFSVGLQVTIGR